MSKRRAKTPPKSPPVEVTTVVPSHGNGELRVGNPGNAGGGRPPSAVRELCRGSFEQRIKILEDIADGEPVVKTVLLDGSGRSLEAKVSASPGDRIKAIDLLGKYGGIEKLTIETPASSSPLAEMSDEQLFRVLRARAENLKADRARQKALRSAGMADDVEALSA